VKQRTVARISLGLVWTTAVLGLASVVAIASVLR
jgi:hypothetical protein